jgi:hypothetical protein
MIAQVIIGGAVALDAFAAGVWVGRKWGSKITKAAIEQAGADAATEVKAIEAKIAPAVAQADAIEDKVEAKLAPVVSDIEAKIKAALAAQTASQPK